MLVRPILITLVMCLITGPVWAATRLAVPSGGSSSGDCTSTACTLVRAISQAVAGDTVTLGNGTYSPMSMTCGGAGGNAANGTAGGRITLKGTNERQAHLQGNGTYALDLINCAYWNIEGLQFSSADVNNGDWHSVVDVITSNHLTFTRNLFHHDNRYNNVHLLDLNCDDCVVEENEFYYFHRHALHQYYANRNVIRRNYLHSRNWADIGGGYPSGPSDRGDEGISVYPGSNNIMENNIIENTGSAFTIDVSAPSIGNKYYGNLAISNDEGWYPNARSNTLASMPQDTTIEHSIAILGRNIGFRFPGNKNTQCKNCSSIGNASNGFYAGVEGGAPGDGSPTVFLTNSLALNNANFGFQFVSQGNWGLNFGNAFNSGTAFSPNDGHITNSTTGNPGMGTCYAWVPDGSPMKGAGSGGSDIGANVLYRYQDGVLTSTPLWDQNSGKFPCGAAVTGVNDVAGSSCFDVHQRLHINTGGCAFPAGYGIVTPPPTPIGNFATYTFDENTGTTAGDTSGQGHPLTLSSAGWGPPIIGVASLATDGTRSASVPLAAGMTPNTTVGAVGWWNGTTPSTCDMISFGDSVILRLNSNGAVSGLFYNGAGWPSVGSSPVNVFDGQSHMLWMTKSPTELRVGVDTATLNTLAITGTITYGLGSQLTIGKHGNGSSSFTCPTGRIDQVRLFDTELTPTAILNLYNEQVPTAGLSVPHLGWYAANAPEGVTVGQTDTHLSRNIATPLGIRWAIRKADPGALTEYFRPFCRVLSNVGAVVLDWTEVTNSFGATGIRFYADSVVSTGTPTSVLLPTDGSTGAPGLYLVNPVDTTGPYAASQRLTIAQNEQREVEMKVEFGSPRVIGEQLECRPYRENGTPFGPNSYVLESSVTTPPPANMLALSSGSPAIDAGSCVAGITTDILGVTRPQGSGCDIGAYEYLALGTNFRLPYIALITPTPSNMLSLSAGSPAINAGACLAGITTDILGRTRPQGAGCDIGAYEFVSVPLVAGSTRSGGTYAGGTR